MPVMSACKRLTGTLFGFFYFCCFLMYFCLVSSVQRVRVRTEDRHVCVWTHLVCLDGITPQLLWEFLLCRMLKATSRMCSWCLMTTFTSSSPPPVSVAHLSDPVRAASHRRWPRLVCPGCASTSEQLPVGATVCPANLQQSAPPGGRNLREGALWGQNHVTLLLLLKHIFLWFCFDWASLLCSGERGAAHHPAHVPVLQTDDGVLLPGPKRWRGRRHGWGRQVQNGHYWYVALWWRQFLSLYRVCTATWSPWKCLNFKAWKELYSCIKTLKVLDVQNGIVL